MYEPMMTSPENLEEAEALIEQQDKRIPLTFQDLLDRPLKKKKVVYLKYYWKLLFVIAIFYGVPSIQFVVSNYKAFLVDEGECYYNFKCTRAFLGLEAFNNVISNIGYIMLGLCFVAYVRIQNPDEDDSVERTTGLHLDMSLYYCLGWAIVLEGIFSALYHVCPSRIDFQFDMTFMIIGAALAFLSIYQKRQPTITSGAFQTFGYLALIVCLNALSLLEVPYRIFWTIVFVIMTYLSITASFHIYYAEKISINRSSLKFLISKLSHPGRPRDIFRFSVILAGVLLNYALSIYFAVSEINGNHQYATQDFPSCILALIMLDTWLYLFYYIVMKYRSGERVYPRVWIFLVVMFVCAGAAMWSYTIPVANKFLSFEESKLLNKPCVLFDYFDYHDTWHFLSAITVILSFLVVYSLDLDINDRPRSQIRIF